MEGNKGRFEFGSNAPAYSEFLFNHYSRFQVDCLIISFINGDCEYSTFGNYESGKEENGISVLNIK
ncbi:hypothetical protein CEQ36_06955 [Yersinia intermedia]|nr:hypothetical protein A6J67_17310 [Yersinia sp. FDAARGOS_228]AVL35385.1 hypothetical protein CEQ36_06955 [Yersinia intermedia]